MSRIQKNPELVSLQSFLNDQLKLKTFKGDKPDGIAGPLVNEALRKTLVEEKDGRGQPLSTEQLLRLRTLVSEWEPKGNEARLKENILKAMPKYEVELPVLPGIGTISGHEAARKLANENVTPLAQGKKADGVNHAKLQERLRGAGYLSARSAKGTYGPQTTEAVKKLQNDLVTLGLLPRGSYKAGEFDKATQEAAARRPSFAGQGNSSAFGQALVRLNHFQGLGNDAGMSFQKLQIDEAQIKIELIGQRASKVKSDQGVQDLPAEKKVKEREEKKLLKRFEKKKLSSSQSPADDQGFLIRNLLETYGHTSTLNTNETWAYAFKNSDFKGISQNQLKQAQEALKNFLARPVDDFSDKVAQAYVEAVHSKPKQHVRAMAEQALEQIEIALAQAPK